jgi:hypothetical protein
MLVIWVELSDIAAILAHAPVASRRRASQSLLLRLQTLFLFLPRKHFNQSVSILSGLAGENERRVNLILNSLLARFETLERPRSDGDIARI